MNEQPRGVLPVVQTPFDAREAVDVGALAYEVQWALSKGVDGLTVGMVSEYLRLSDDERIAVAETIVGAASGRPVVVSVGAESTAAARALAVRAEAVGAAALMAIPPISVSPDESEITRYYEGLLSAVALPVIVQDASGYVGRPLSLEMQVDLLERYGARVMFKPEADPIGPRLTALRDRTEGRAHAFEGSGGIALIDSFRRGIAGTMPAVDLCWALVALWRALCHQDDDAAYSISGPLAGLISMQTTIDSYVAIEKYLLVRQGVLESDRRRGPLAYELDLETRAEVDRLFDRLTDAVEATQGAVP